MAMRMPTETEMFHFIFANVAKNKDELKKDGIGEQSHKDGVSCNAI